MVMTDRASHIDSPIQQHPVYVANDVQWITGELKTLGNPHYYINQDDQDTFNILDAHILPWSFTGLPASHTPQSIVFKNKVQLLLFPDPTSKEGFRAPLRTSIILLQLPLAVVRGEAPFLSEATIDNFLEYWKPTFFPMTNVNVHYLADTASQLPTEIECLYINRYSILSYISG